MHGFFPLDLTGRHITERHYLLQNKSLRLFHAPKSCYLPTSHAESDCEALTAPSCGGSRMTQAASSQPIRTASVVDCGDHAPERL